MRVRWSQVRKAALCQAKLFEFCIIGQICFITRHWVSTERMDWRGETGYLCACREKENQKQQEEWEGRRGRQVHVVVRGHTVGLLQGGQL